MGETGRHLRERLSEHLRSIRNRSPGLPVAEHFNSANLTIDDIRAGGIDQCTGKQHQSKAAGDAINLWAQHAQGGWTQY